MAEYFYEIDHGSDGYYVYEYVRRHTFRRETCYAIGPLAWAEVFDVVDVLTSQRLVALGETF